MAALKGIVPALEQFRFAEAMFPQGTRRSLPLPVLVGGKPRAAVMYARAEIVEPKQGAQLWPPNFTAMVDLEAGKLDSIRAVTPKDFGRDDNPEEPLGSYPAPAEILTSPLVEQHAKYLATWDAVAAEFFGGGSPRAAAVAREFMKLFEAVSEKPYAAYYQALGSQFFAWIKKVCPDAAAR